MRQIKPKNVEEAEDLYNIAYRVDFSLSCLANKWEDDPEECHVEIIGDIYSSPIWGDANEIRVGEIKLIRFQLDTPFATNHSFYDVMDSACDETEKLYFALCNRRSGRIKKSLISKLPDVPYIESILHIHRLMIEPECRGMGLGKQIALRAIELFSHRASIVTTLPFALQYEGCRDGIEEEQLSNNLSPEEDADFQKVYKFWRSMGFRKIPGTRFYLLQKEFLPKG